MQKKSMNGFWYVIAIANDAFAISLMPMQRLQRARILLRETELKEMGAEH